MPFERRMSDLARAELVDAIQHDTFRNASRYAEEFAARHDLNPATVRSTISRLRREMGLLKRPRKPGTPTHGEDAVQRSVSTHALPDISPIAVLEMGDVLADVRFVRLGAAVLIRYERDEAFRRAVDESRVEMEALQHRVEGVREITSELSSEDRDALIHLLRADSRL